MIAMVGVEVMVQGQGVWDGGTSGLGTSWNSANNWAGDAIPAAGSNILFSSRTGGGTLPSTLSVSGALTFGNITFDNVSGALPATLNINTNGSGSTARTLRINNGVTLQNTNTAVIFQGNFGVLSVVLGGPNVFTTSAGSLLQFNSGVTVSGGFGITTAGAGTVSLNNANNSFTGGVNVGSGTTLRLGAPLTGSAMSSVVSGGVLSSGQVGTGTLTLNDQSTLTSTGSGARTLQNQVAMEGAVTLGGVGSFTGPITFNSSSGVGVGQTLATAATVALLGNVELTTNVLTTIENAVTGAFQLTKRGGAPLVLSGANSYSGGTVIEAGPLVFGNRSAIPAVGGVTVAASGTFGLRVGQTSDLFGAGDVDLAFAGTFPGVSNDVASGVGIDTTAGDFTYGTSIAVTERQLVKLGANRLSLTGINGYTGATQVLGGVLDVGELSAGALGSGGLILQNDAVLQGSGFFDRAFSGTAAPGPGQVAGVAGGFAARGGELTLNFGGAGALLALSTGNSRLGDHLVFGSATADSPVVLVNPLSTNGTFTRFITVNAGVGGDYALLQGVISSTGNIVKQGDGRLIIGANGTFTGATTINGGILQFGNGGTTGTLSTTSGVTINSGRLVFNRSNSFTFSPVIAGAGLVEVAGTGTATLSGVNSYAGGTLLSSGTLSISAVENLGAPESPLVFDGGSLQISGTSLASLSGLGRTVTFSPDKTVGFNINSVGHRFLVDQGLGHGAGGLTKSGNGILVLGEPSSYTGLSSIQGGVLEVGALGMGRLGGGGLLFSGNSVLQGHGEFTRPFSATASAPGAGELLGTSGGFAARGGELIVNFGGSESLVTLNTGAARFGTNFVFGSAEADSPVIVLNPLSTGGTFTRTFTVVSGVGGDYAELRGVISSTGNLVKAGNGRLILTADNTNSGMTTISLGTLQIGAGGMTGSLNSASGVVNNGVLVFDRQGVLTMSAEISGAGQVQQVGVGTTRLLTANSYAGGTLVSGGTLMVENTSGSATGSGSLTTLAGTILAGDGRVGVLGTDSIEVNGLISPGRVGNELATLAFSTVEGDLTLGSTASFQFELGMGGLSDRVVFQSAGAGKMDFSAMPSGSMQVLFGVGYTPNVFDVFDLLNWEAAMGGGMTGLNANQLAALPMHDFEPTWMWDTSQFATQGVISIQFVPEPSRLMLVGMAVLVTCLQRRRRRKAW
jgi:fibronectin-binding autotransporter adhesin